MRYQNVIFDLDGTLTQSEEGIFTGIERTLRCMGWPVPEKEQLRRFIGPPLYWSFHYGLGMSVEEAEKAQRIYRAYYRSEGWKRNRAYPGIPRLLRSLKEAGIRSFVATGKPKHSAEDVCQYFGLSPYLSGIVGPTDDDRTADKAGFLSDILEKAGRNTVMVGDRHYDADAARECGIPCIGVTFGYGSEEELKNAGATELAGSVRDLQKLLLGEAEPARGLFLTLEGMDGCGKTTQREKIVDFLLQRGWEVSVTREPGGDNIAEKIRQIILDPANTEMCPETEAYLYAASRAQNVRRRILPALMDGMAVVCDRFVDSSVAYQGGGRGLGPEQIADLNRIATGGLDPDLTVFLDLEPEVSLARRLRAGEPDRLESEQESFFRRVHETYHRFFQENDRVLKIDASRSIGEVTEELLSGLAKRIDALPV